MSAIFARDENDEGLEMPVREAVSKSMLCMVFGLVEKEFLYIFNEAKEVQSTMLGAEATFTPLKAGKYLVKTADENDLTKELKKLELPQVDLSLPVREKTPKYVRKEIPKFVETNKILSTTIVRDQPDDIVKKIMRKLDAHTLGKLAQTCIRMENILNDPDAGISMPMTIDISFYEDDVHVISFGNDKTGFKKPYTFDEEKLRVLNPFRFQGIQLNAKDDTKPEHIAKVYDIIINSRIRADKLVVTNIDMSVVVQLLASTEAKHLTFKKKINKEMTTYNTTEPFPKLDILEFSEIPMVEIRDQKNFFSNFFSRNATIIRVGLRYTIEPIKDVFEKFLEITDSGSNKIFQILTEGFYYNEVPAMLLRDRVWRVWNQYEYGRNNKTNVQTIFVENGDQDLLIHNYKENENRLLISIGRRGKEFWNIVHQQ